MQYKELKNLFSFSTGDAEPYEPGLLPAYRLFVAIQILGLSVGMTIEHFIDSNVYVGITGPAFLLLLIIQFLYLSWSVPLRLFGKYYLPLALFFSVLIPMLQRVVMVLIYSSQQSPISFLYHTTEGGWRTIVLLMMPAIFVAWQYRFRIVLLFSMAILIVNNIVLGLSLHTDTGYWVYLIDYGLIGAGSFVLIGIIVTRLMAAQRDKQRILMETNRQLVEYAKTVEQLAVSHERNRMARDLHDTVLHTLSAVSMQLEAADAVWDQAPVRANELVRSSLHSTRSGLAETRRALRALRASPLEDLGLILALRSFAESITTRNGIQLETNLPENILLSAEIEQGVYRISQEALRNAVQHSDAETIWLSIRETDNDWIVEIRDDGIGIDDQSINEDGHYGLLGMRERAESIGIELTMHSRTGEGTTVRQIITKT